MIKIKQRIFAGIILFSLIVVPFLDWRLGAVMWISAWLIFIFQKLFNRQEWKLGDDEQPDNDDDEQPDNEDKHHLE